MNLTTSTPDVIVTTDKGIFVKRIYLKNFNSQVFSSYVFNGIYQWNITYDSLVGSDTLKGFLIDSQDNIILGGYESTNYNIILRKYDKNGNLLWNKTIDGGGLEFLKDITVDSQDNIFIAGEWTDNDIFFRKYDKDGNQIWNDVRAYSSDDWGEGITLDSNNNIVTISASRNNGLYYSIVVNKYNTSGSLIWNKTLKSFHDIYPNDIISYGDNYFIIGNYYNNSNLNDIFIAKYDSSGLQLWNNSFGSNQNDRPEDLTVDNFGNIYITGLYYNTTSKYFISKYDGATGNRIWYNEYPASLGLSIIYKNNAIYSGAYDGLVPYFVKLDLNGNILWNSTYNLPGNAYPEGIGLSSTNDLFIGGNYIDGSDSDFFVLKYS